MSAKHEYKTGDTAGMKKPLQSGAGTPQPHSNDEPSTTMDLVEQIAALKQKISAQEILVSQAGKKAERQGQLLATVSHELRTEMGAIINLVEILSETNLDHTQHRFAKTLEGSATGLLRVLNDVLDHSKYESGQFELVCRNFSPRELINTVIDTQIIPCQNKGLTLSLEISNDLPDQLYGDALRIRQVLSNLVTNAVKFTSSGSIDLSISTSGLENNHQLLEFRVKDTGIGVRETQKDRLFTPYVQADAEVSTRHGGTGLGLSICRQLVSMMDGEIDFSSEKNKGSEFWFNVKCKPYQKDAGDEPDSAQDLHHVLALKKEHTGHILIVEDNKTNQMLISTYLEKFGHTFEIVNSGEQALEAVKNGKFDAILMDVLMPGIDGMETTRRLRKSQGYARSIPVIALTANAMSGDKEKYLAAGMDDYLTKPINAAKLFHTLEKSLASSQVLASK